MNPHGSAPYACMQDAAARPDRTTGGQELARMRDGAEYPYEVLNPALQDLAEALMQRPRARTAQLGA